MRLTDTRYERDLLRYGLALRLLRAEARNRAIQRWTGLSMRRVRTLRAYAQDARHPFKARRGVMPYQAAVFFGSGTVKSEAAVLAGFLYVFGVMPAEPLAHPERDLPSLARGMRLCDAYAQFTACLPQSRLSIEHAMLLLTQLALSVDITLDRCPACDVLLVRDRLAISEPMCTRCQRSRPKTYRVPAGPIADESPKPLPGPATPRQGSLF